jgi:methylated-DNA-[protein]-cysteine S-methyltransferase
MNTNFQRVKSPVGELYLVAKDKKLCAVVFKKNWNSFKKNFREIEEAETPILKRAKQQLSEYFKGKRRSFNAL